MATEAAQRSGSWEHFPHGADIGVRGRGASRDEAFAQAAVAMTAVVTRPEAVLPTARVEIRCENPDPELLLADWLNALVFEMATRGMLFGRFDVRSDDGLLQATAWGEAVDRERHQPAVEVKGATYTGLRVGRDAAGRWVAECVVDV